MPAFSAEAIAAIPLSLYLHWPWCVRKCPYCDFNSHAAPPGLDEGGYADAVLRDMDGWLGRTQGRPLASIFIGGGTPSLMSGRTVARLIEGARERFGLAPGCEITLEANPGTVDEAKFAAFREAGVSRLSIGVQSFSDARLKAIGRIHDAAQARSAVKSAARLFDNFNLDLMFALPGETLEGVLADAAEAAESGATHLSFYQLTIEPGTAFAKRLPAGLPDADAAADMSDAVGEALEEAGFEHYEVSGYAKPGHRCRHNLNYWLFGDYLAAGAGAHGKLTEPPGIVRERRLASPRLYVPAALQGRGAEEVRRVEERDLPFEFMLNALRLREGVPAALFEERTGMMLSKIDPILAHLRAEGLLERDPALLRPTARGRAFLSDVQEAFL
jgi:oxygen-independent coproporphyrinogen-3 oxidase